MHPLVPVQTKYSTSSKGRKVPTRIQYRFHSRCMRYLLPFGHSVSYANSAVKQLPLILSRWSAPNSPIRTARLAILHYCDTALRSDYCTTHRQQSLKAVEQTELIQNGKYWKMFGVLGIKALWRDFVSNLWPVPFQTRSCHENMHKYTCNLQYKANGLCQGEQPEKAYPKSMATYIAPYTITTVYSRTTLECWSNMRIGY